VSLGGWVRGGVFCVSAFFFFFSNEITHRPTDVRGA